MRPVQRLCWAQGAAELRLYAATLNAILQMLLHGDASWQCLDFMRTDMGLGPKAAAKPLSYHSDIERAHN